MMHRNTRYKLIAILVVAALILQPVLSTVQLMLSSPAWLQPFTSPVARAQQTGGSVYLPLVANGVSKPTPPAFTISTPSAGGSVSGMIFFAIQPLDPATIISVTFKAGNAVLGTDNTADDGFKIFANASSLPAGITQFSATATGPGGSATQNVAVTVVPNPPSSATVGATGGVLASKTGSVISIQPGSVPEGTTITVTEMTQDEVTAKHGIQWDNIGVTFLGQQDIQSSAPISRPLGSVSSAGFGNRVQPGQAVVNYRILPDADGDGADEIVVVNTASVAPNGAVVADPSIQTQLQPSIVVATQAAAMLSGPPGHLIDIPVSGFNLYSQESNTAIFTPLDNAIKVAGNIYTNPTDSSKQIFRVTIPYLKAGPATLVLRNESTGQETKPIPIMIEPFRSLQGTPDLVFGELIDTYISIVNQQKADDLQNPSDPELAAAAERYGNELVTHLTEIRERYKELYTLLASTKVQEAQVQVYIDEMLLYMKNVASMIEVLNIEHRISRESIFSSMTTDRRQGCIVPYDPRDDVIAFMKNITTPPYYGSDWSNNIAKAATGALIIAAAIGATEATLIALGVVVTAAGAIVVGRAATGLINNLFNNITNALNYTNHQSSNVLRYANQQNADQCSAPGPQSGGNGGANSGPITGMGSAPPPGGNGFGSVAGSGKKLIQASASSQPAQSSQVAIKIYVNGKATPFTGMADPGGYFFIPLIPQNEPFTAIAIDRSTGETRSFTGVGPQIGKSVFMFFDFFNEEPPSIRWDGGGDGTSWEDAKNWDTDRTPIAADRVAIDAPANTKIIISKGNVEVVSLHNSASLQLSGSALTLNANSVISGSLVITNGAALNVKEVAAALTVSGDLAVSNSALRANGLNAKIEAHGNVALYRTDLNATNGSKILLPTAQQYNAGSGGIATGVVVNATGAGSRIDLSKVTSLLGDTSWGGDLVVQAINGGQVDLQSTAVLTTGNMKVTADSAGSQVNLSGLQRLESTPGFQGGNSLLAVKNGGTILVPNLTRLSQVDLNLNAGGTVATSQMISYTNGQATFTGLVVDLNNLTTLDNVNFILKSGGNVHLNGLTQMRRVGLDVNDGVTFVAPNLKRYDASSGAIASGVTFKATGAGSRIDLSAVTTLLGDVGWGGGFAVKAINGGQIDLRNSTRLITGTMSVLADGVNSTVDLSSLTEFRATPGFQGDQAALEVGKDGVINLNGNTLTLQKVVVLVHAGGVLNCSALTLVAEAKLAGDGVVPCAVTNQGEVAPGFSPAMLTLTKSYVQASAGALAIEIGGTSAGNFDTLAISGVATLAGTLNIALLNDFQPNLGDNFTILSAGSLAGTFATLNGSAIGNGKKFQVQYGASSVTLQVVPQ